MNCTVRKRQRYICPQQACRREMEVLAASNTGRPTAARCLCGSYMKKAYEKPVLRNLTNAEARALLPVQVTDGRKSEDRGTTFLSFLQRDG